MDKKQLKKHLEMEFGHRIRDYNKGKINWDRYIGLTNEIHLFVMKNADRDILIKYISEYEKRLHKEYRK